MRTTNGMTTDEIKFIFDNQGTMTIAEIAKATGRSYMGIFKRIKDGPNNKSLQRRVLPFFAWCDLVKAVLTDLGMVCPSRSDLADVYKPPMISDWAAIYRSGDRTVWADRYYIAHQVGEGEVVYDYISIYHVDEERRNWGKKWREMPSDVLRQLEAAELWMKSSSVDKCWFKNRLNKGD